MSLTSYRAAPSRAKGAPRYDFEVHRSRDIVLLIRFGNDLLSHALRRSTISAAALNCRVRDGIGCFARAMTTKPRKKRVNCRSFEKEQQIQVEYTVVYAFNPQKSDFY